MVHWVFPPVRLTFLMLMHLANPRQVAIVRPMVSNYTHHNVVAVPAGQVQIVVRPDAVVYPSLSLLFLLP